MSNSKAGRDAASITLITSVEIAEFAGLRHHSVTRLIRRYPEDFAEFGAVLYRTERAGRGRPRKIYLLNEQQAALLISCLKNTPKVVDFKTEFVRRLYAMKKELATESECAASRK